AEFGSEATNAARAVYGRGRSSEIVRAIAANTIGSVTTSRTFARKATTYGLAVSGAGGGALARGGRSSGGGIRSGGAGGVAVPVGGAFMGDGGWRPARRARRGSARRARGAPWSRSGAAYRVRRRTRRSPDAASES